MLAWVTLALAGPNTAMVGFEHDPEAILAVPTQATRCYARARFCVLEFDGPPPIETLSRLQGVRYAERDRLIDGVAAWGDASGTDDCPTVWDLEAVSAPDVWDAGVTSGPVIAVADGGFLTSHEEIAGRISGQWDYGDGDPTANLEWDVGVPAHGTFIASIVAGNPDNGRGRAGVIPDGRLNLLKIADSSGAFYFSYAASALADVADGDLGIRAVVYSIASSTTTDSFRDAVVSLDSVGVLLVAAAGNCGSANCGDADNDAHPLYPANFAYEHVVTVAGSTPGGGFNTWSHYGASSVDLAAPGVDICAAGVTSNDSYYSAAGTSYAAPIVAAAIGLLDTAHPSLTTTEVGRVLRASAVENPEWAEKTRSEGVLDIERALATAVPRLEEPAGVVVDENGVLELTWRNVGSAGTAVFVVTHDGLVEGAFEPGSVVSLPDAGEWTATTSGQVVSFEVEAHQAGVLEVPLVGAEVGSGELTVRLVMDSTNYLNAPYASGSTDPTGFLAWTVPVEVTAVASVDSSVDSPVESGVDSPVDSVVPVDSEAPGAPAGCGCGGGAPAGGLVLVLLALARRRRG